MNKVLLTGNLTRNPETTVVSEKFSVTRFSIAINDRSEKEPTFIDCEAHNGTGGIIQKYLTKGSKIIVEGKLKLDTWTNKTDNTKRSRLKVIVKEFEFAGAPRKNSNSENHEDNGNGNADVPQEVEEACPF